jgi:hypothetical protein
VVLKMLAGLLRGPEPVGDADGLRSFLAAESAFLAQKTTIEYCRARSGLLWQKLFEERDFRAALEICRWGSMAAVLADQVVVTEAFLRRHAGERKGALAAALAGVYEDILLGYTEVPPEQRAGWESLIGDMAPRLARMQLGPPHSPDEIAKTAGALVYDLLPIHKSLRGHDREMMVNAVRFGMVGFHRKLTEVVRDPAALVQALTAGPRAPV